MGKHKCKWQYCLVALLQLLYAYVITLYFEVCTVGKANVSVHINPTHVTQILQALYLSYAIISNEIWPCLPGLLWQVKVASQHLSSLDVVSTIIQCIFT